MDEIKKENFDMKLRIYHLEDKLRLTSNAQMDALFQEVHLNLSNLMCNLPSFQNTDLKVRNDALASENRTYKELVEAAQAAVHHQQQLAAARS